MVEEIEEESVDEVKEVGAEFEAEEVDEDEIELEESEAAEEEQPKRKKKKKGGKDDDTVAPKDLEQVVKANPKRQNKQQKQVMTIEGILDAAKLETEEGAVKAWAALQAQSGGGKPRKYSFKAELALNDLIAHRSFGQGYVVEILSPTKVSVLFEDGMKRLAHNRG